MSDAEVIAYHGWGFDSGCWSSWEKMVPDAIRWRNFNRGYFGHSCTPDFSGNSNLRMVATHSFGLHLCDKQKFKQVDVLIIFSGFFHLHPKAAQFRRRSKQILNGMINQFGDDPQKVLKTFYKNVFHPEKKFELPQKKINQPLLLDDLKKLGRSELKTPALKKSAKVFIFHGARDAIIPKQKGRALFEALADRAQYFEIKKCGHALPFTRSKKCWQMIEPEISELIS